MMVELSDNLINRLKKAQRNMEWLEDREPFKSLPMMMLNKFDVAHLQLQIVLGTIERLQKGKDEKIFGSGDPLPPTYT